MNQQITEQQIFEQRQKFVLAFNDTMLKIWREQMTLLGVIDTGRLLHSPKSLPVRADGRFIELGLSQSFIEYGLWQNFGTGKEIPRGNKGDIGRERKRKKKPWFKWTDLKSRYLLRANNCLWVSPFASTIGVYASPKHLASSLASVSA